MLIVSHIFLKKKKILTLSIYIRGDSVGGKTRDGKNPGKFPGKNEIPGRPWKIPGKFSGKKSENPGKALENSWKNPKKTTRVIIKINTNEIKPN